MPFPSPACLTCRQRREGKSIPAPLSDPICDRCQCDETRPVCNQCTRVGRECSYDRDVGDLVFVNENVHASTGAPRLRGGASVSTATGSTSTVTRTDSCDSGDTVQGSKRSSRRSSKRPYPTKRRSDENEAGSETLQLTTSPTQDLPTVATQAFINTYISSDEQDPFCTWSLVLQFEDQYGPGKPYSVVNTALSAVSLVYLSKVHNLPEAFSEARRKYGQALIKTKTALGQESLASTDEVLLSVMLLGAYETMVGNFDPTTLYTESYRHHDGAQALLMIGKGSRENGTFNGNIVLDQSIRRLLLRQTVYRGTKLPPWMQDGSEFGEVGLHLELDACLNLISELRQRTLNLRNQMIFPSMDFFDPEQEDLLDYTDFAVGVSQRLADWADSVPPEQRWTTQTCPESYLNLIDERERSLVYGRTVYTYPDIQTASMWNRYRGARIVAESSVANGLLHLEQADLPGLPRYIEVLATIKSLVNDICASIPYQFNVLPPIMGIGRSGTVPKDDGRRANLLCYQLIMSGSLSVIHKDQRRWLLDKLRLVSEITGNQVIRQLADVSLMHYCSETRANSFYRWILPVKIEIRLRSDIRDGLMFLRILDISNAQG